jgi:hypothetical protein
VLRREDAQSVPLYGSLSRPLLVPLLSLLYPRLKHTVVAPWLLQAAPQTLLHAPYGSLSCHPKRHASPHYTRNSTRSLEYSCSSCGYVRKAAKFVIGQENQLSISGGCLPFCAGFCSQEQPYTARYCVCVFRAEECPYNVSLNAEANEEALCPTGSTWAKRLNSVAWVRERTIPTERPPLVKEVGTNGSLRQYYWFSGLQPLLFLSSSFSIVFTKLSGSHFRPITSRKVWQRRESNLGPLDL